ncbi:S41 family peptidase [Chitinimonas sp. BJYL2]|uniref:S41 family peptidase n=1 Tax=Chitinimonas sp. BJYL2 TaxID=2976696 RepID=UPI0022B3B43F|nr:S41 family peptidase [Chitinimonas sp. BJYL2]
MTPTPLRTLLLTCLLWCAHLCYADNLDQQPSYPPEQLQADFRFMQEAIAQTHPDVGHSVDPAALATAFQQVEAQLTQPMTRDEAWQRWSTLNPLFADAHLAITQPDWRSQTAAFLKAGGALFPFAVYIDPQGHLFIRTDADGTASPFAGARITRINGQPADKLVAAVLARTHGDTAAFRNHVAARRWFYLYWKLHGAPDTFELTLQQGKKTRQLSLAASKHTPVVLQADAEFAKQFSLDLLSDATAVLTIKAFYWPDKPAYFAFMEQSFQRIRDAGIRKLIIDIRDNEGGDDDMWKSGILKYIASKPYRTGSSYVKKVIAGRASGNEKVGDVVHGEIATWEQPLLTHPLHFSGQTYVLVGRHTYSSAVLFANTVQDFGIAQLVGAGGYVRTRQSGGIQVKALPHTGLEIVAPRFILSRPSGQQQTPLLQPDLVLPDPPFAPQALITQLRNHLRR